MKHKLFIFTLLIIIFYESSVCQETQNNEPFLSNNFKTSILIKYIPEALKNNPYFSKREIISGVRIYGVKDDTLYFFSKGEDLKKPNCVIIYTSDNKITAYNYLEFTKVDNNEFYSSCEIKLPNNKNIFIDFYFHPVEESIDYQFFDKKTANSPSSNLISNFESEYESNFEVGFRYELSYMSNRIFNINGYFNSYELGILPINLHLAGGFRFLKNYKLDFRLGLKFIYEDFYGSEKGIFFQANLFNSKFFGIVGIDFFHNFGESHGVMVYSESGGENTFYCFGVGYQTSKHFNLDITYLIPKNKVYGYNQDNSAYPIIKNYDKIVNNLISLGLQYSFIF